jgi:hypothetical protein
MEPVLYMDEFEPDEMMALLKQSSSVVQIPLNRRGNADYWWTDINDNARQWERKQCGEAVSDLDAVEEQLNRELSTCNELTLVVEGIMQPTPRGVHTYRLSRDGSYFHPYTEIPRPEAKPQPGLWLRWQMLKQGLKYAGVQVVETPSIISTAAAISAAFHSSMKPEHTTLRRYVQPHIAPFSNDPHVDNLARIKGAGIGPGQAKKLVARYKTFHGAVTAHKLTLIQVLGRKSAYKFMSAIGRDPDERGLE